MVLAASTRFKMKSSTKVLLIKFTSSYFHQQMWASQLKLQFATLKHNCQIYSGPFFNLMFCTVFQSSWGLDLDSANAAPCFFYFHFQPFCYSFAEVFEMIVLMVTQFGTSFSWQYSDVQSSVWLQYRLRLSAFHHHARQLIWGACAKIMRLSVSRHAAVYYGQISITLPYLFTTEIDTEFMTLIHMSLSKLSLYCHIIFRD